VAGVNLPLLPFGLGHLLW